MNRSIDVHRRAAFTLVELLVVIAVIGLLIALLLPAVQGARESARRTQCANNLKQIGLAVVSFHDSKKAFPPARVGGYGHASWAARVLPFIEQQAIADLWDLEKTYFLQTPDARQAQVSTYLCPSRRSGLQLSVSGDVPADDPMPTGVFLNHMPGAVGDYACSVHHNAITGFQADPPSLNYIYSSGAMIRSEPFLPFPWDWTSTIEDFRWRYMTRVSDILDGMSNTLLIGEKHVRLENLGKRSGGAGYGGSTGYSGEDGDNSIYNGDHYDNFARVAGPANTLARFSNQPYNSNFGSFHPGVCQFVLCDGSVRAMSVSVDGVTLERLVRRKDGEAVMPR